MMETKPTGFLFIGDPHLATRTPGFRKDDYPTTLVTKLRWCLDYATAENLVPVLLGDIFHLPRDNANWLLVECFELCRASRYPVLAVVGNHDCYENSLSPNDTLAVLYSGGALRLLDSSNPWFSTINGTWIMLGGTPWNCRIPSSLPEELFSKRPKREEIASLVLWVTHHDIAFSGYEENARIRPHSIEGIDIIINGHIHKRLPDIKVGQTTWLNPGNIARVTRSESTRQRRPAAMRMDIHQGQWSIDMIPVPCLPFEEVFFEITEVSIEVDAEQSIFVTGLAQLEAFKSATGAGLMHFLDTNLSSFDEAVQIEIRKLAHEVLNNDANINE